MKKLILTRKNVYGNILIYPINTNAVIFCSLVGKKTLGENDLDLIVALGYELEYVPFV